MSEYIVCVDDLEESYYRYTDIQPKTVFGHRLREEIVRCKDCKFADWDITAWWCIRNEHYPFEIGELNGYGERSHLDGFCAWGVRRDG